MIHIDGKMGEGGGQIARTAMALSCLTGKSFEITDIRAGRSKPGLKAQHLSAIKALKEICGAQTNEVSLGSDKLRFLPGKIKGGRYVIDIGTAGSISLLLQALIIPCLFASSKVTLLITGGTSGKWQAPVDYLSHVLLPQLQRFAKIEMRLLKRGYYPRGGGKIELGITPTLKRKEFTTTEKLMEYLGNTIAPITLLEQGKLLKINGISHAASSLQEAQVAERQASTAKTLLGKYKVPVLIRTEYQQTLNPGSGITLWATFDNSNIVGEDALGEKGLRAEAVGEDAAKALMEVIDSGAPVDEHLADQLIPFMGLLSGSKIKTHKISTHTETNCRIVEKFLPVTFETQADVVESKSDKEYRLPD